MQKFFARLWVTKSKLAFQESKIRSFAGHRVQYPSRGLAQVKDLFVSCQHGKVAEWKWDLTFLAVIMTLIFLKEKNPTT